MLESITSAPGPDSDAFFPYMEGLNECQREAVEATDGPVLVLAGAGTGKTRVLTTRIAHILMQSKGFPGEILAVTFTNKAAREMRERVAAIIGQGADGLWLGTFHSIGMRILRRHAEAVGLQSNFTILDTDDQLRLIKLLLAEAGIDDKKFPPKVFLACIQGWKDRGLMPEKVGMDDRAALDGRAHKLYEHYQARLRTLNATDFGDLLLLPLVIFSRHPDILDMYARRFRYILVDEYQDTNIAQYLLLRLLAMQHRNICCVGDDDQSIYSWRGAEIGNILKFEQDFSGAKVVRLECNYRSTQHILGAASGLIAHNRGRLGKTLWTPQEGGEKIELKPVWDDAEEARFIGERIEDFQRAGTGLNQIAILVRAGFQTRSFEEHFLTLGIPYRVIGGLRFYERAEIRDALAYLRVLEQPDDDLALERIVNTPKRGIGKASIEALRKIAHEREISLYRAAEQQILAGEVKGKAGTELAKLLHEFKRWRELSQDTPHADLTARILEESGYTAMWKAEKTAEAQGRLENLRELISAMDEFENLQEFLEHVSLVTEMESNTTGEMVSLMTLHGAKGLEYDIVFLPGWEEGLFPHQRAMDEGGTAGLEEERRLAYVGITRAKRRLTITYAANRRIYNQWQSSIPSRFLDELPEGHIEKLASAGFYGSRGHLPRQTDEIDTLMNRLRAKREAPRLPSESPAQAGASTRISPSRGSQQGNALAPGKRVHHQSFGYGVIKKADGRHLEVIFENGGLKKLMADYVTAA